MIYVKECTVGGRFLITGPSRKSLPGVFLLSSFLHLSHTLMVSFLSSFWLPLLSTFQSFSVFFFFVVVVVSPFLIYLLSLPSPHSHPIHSRIFEISIHVGLLFHPLDQKFIIFYQGK